MKTLLVASTNAGKIKEIREILKVDFSLLSPRDERFEKTVTPEVDESGESYFENSLKKALHFYAVYRIPVLADDSGLEIDALGGEPGVHSARFGGTGWSWAQRWEELFKRLRNFPPAQWTARFRSVLCYYDGRQVPFFFHGTVEGCLVSSPRGEAGFGYDPIFFSPELAKTFGECSDREKSTVSHRAKALADFLQWSRLDRQDP